MTSSVRTYRQRAVTWPIGAVAGACLLLAACGSSSNAATAPPASAPATTSAPAPAATGSATTIGGSGASNASVTVSTATLPGLGTVLVNGDGRTLYVLASEKGGHVNCTATGGCTKAWPAVVVPAGMAKGIAGNGVQASLLGTVTSPAGDVRLTYGGWPLYTFIGDSKAGVATGQDLTDAYGLWWALSPSGTPVTTSPAASSPSTPTPTTVPTSGGGVSY
jgi:predicted lipoprotein with Yx(FWY)xxD motif